jgi:hypothetical protein
MLVQKWGNYQWHDARRKSDENLRTAYALLRPDTATSRTHLETLCSVTPGRWRCGCQLLSARVTLSAKQCYSNRAPTDRPVIITALYWWLIVMGGVHNFSTVTIVDSMWTMLCGYPETKLVYCLHSKYQYLLAVGLPAWWRYTRTAILTRAGRARHETCNTNVWSLYSSFCRIHSQSIPSAHRSWPPDSPGQPEYSSRP